MQDVLPRSNSSTAHRGAAVRAKRTAGDPAGLLAPFLVQTKMGTANLLRGHPASDLDGEYGLLPL